MVERMHADRALRVLAQTRDGFLAGLRFYRARSHKGYGLTDCISMEMMHREGLSAILTDDAHFARKGFVCLPRA